MIDYIWRVNNLDVYYTNETNGGGDYFAIEYMQVVKEWYGTVDSALEWCSGPGFIGFSLLATGACKHIAFNDMYDPAIEMLERTKENSLLSDNINIYQGSTLENISSDKKFDLIVGNPPHWPSIESAANSLGFNPEQFAHVTDILVDEDWHSHKNFYKHAKTLLSENGRILLQENSAGSQPQNFEEMINEAGLKIASVANSVMYADKHIYYIEVEHI